ncbi:glycosyltransferase [Microbacterium sp. BG28]|uniref:glycosyltransferase family 2 protein n=1 Tax=Microbacterium sp. BG28 TaxID=3097356 RepID=UPI002A5A1AC4|nr:glycosyltransferase [Microbacterium sp. BG28]MDY0830366.1 glycosyltransferase [Microbacterium sp. BG28]
MTLDIFIPYWGDPALLKQTVASVLAQRDPQWRLTVIDDCYPDPSVAEWFAQITDERVRYLRNDANLGITGNYREAVRLADEPYMMLLGSDDLLHPDYVGLIAQTIRAVPNADVVQPGVNVIDESGAVVKPLADRVKQRLLAPRRGEGVAVLRGETMATSLIRGDWLYWPSLTFRTSALKGTDFREGLPIIQDLALLMDLAFAGATLVYNPTVAFSYRRHSASASQRTILDGTRFRDERAYYRQAHELAAARGWKRTAHAARLRPISRLHAVTELPGVIRRPSAAGLRSTLSHVFSL